MKIEFEFGRRNVIRWLVTSFSAAAVGLILGVWVAKLDPTGTGGSILAFPAIFTAILISGAAFLVGLAAFYTPAGRNLLAFAVLLWPSFFFFSAFCR